MTWNIHPAPGPSGREDGKSLPSRFPSPVSPALWETHESNFANSQMHLLQSTLLFSALKFSLVSFLIVWFLCNFNFFSFGIKSVHLDSVNEANRHLWASVVPQFSLQLESFFHQPAKCSQCPKVSINISINLLNCIYPNLGIFLSPSDLIAASILLIQKQPTYFSPSGEHTFIYL